MVNSDEMGKNNTAENHLSMSRRGYGMMKVMSGERLFYDSLRPNGNVINVTLE